MAGSIFVIVDSCPDEDLSSTNRLILNPNDYTSLRLGPGVPIQIPTLGGGGRAPIFSVCQSSKMRQGYIGFNRLQRGFLRVERDTKLNILGVANEKPRFIHSMLVEMDFLGRSKTSKGTFDTEAMKKELINRCLLQNKGDYYFVCLSQPLVFTADFEGASPQKVALTILTMEASQDITKGTTVQMESGFLNINTDVRFRTKEGVVVRMKGAARDKASTKSSIPLAWDFNKMGIGGLDEEFATIFRRAFASRVFPPDLVEQLDLKHVRGMLLYGPPGTGKTLIARKIGQLLNAREPKIVNGPEILDKYVGEAEANIRKLFADAEEEHRKFGISSSLHVIILDEIDAICKSRGSVAGSSGVHDTVVNQLLSKIDGVEELNNILVIGMTNRKDMIDEALLRPGRLEVQMEIGLPDEHGRLQILRIHTAKIKENKKLAENVDLGELAGSTKNFSGAELAGLVRAATSTAMHRLVKMTSKAELDDDAANKLQVTRDDFNIALDDIKPAFGASNETLETYMGAEIIPWGKPLEDVFRTATLSISRAAQSTVTPLVTLLLAGAPQSGSTAIAAKIAQDSNFPFVRICSAEKMIGYTESAKCQAIKAVFDDAYKSPLSIVILDDIERLIDYSPLGPRYSNLALQALLVLLKKVPQKGRKILLVGTTNCKEVLNTLGILQVFQTCIDVPYLTQVDHLLTVLRANASFDDQEMAFIKDKLARRDVHIGIKKLINITEEARQAPSDKASVFISLLLQSSASFKDFL